VDTTGAGELVRGGIVHAFLSGRDLHGCLTEAMLAALCPHCKSEAQAGSRT